MERGSEKQKFDPNFGQYMVIADKLGQFVKKLAIEDDDRKFLLYPNGQEIGYQAAISSLRRGTINREIEFILQEDNPDEVCCVSVNSNLVTVVLNNEFYNRIKFDETGPDDEDIIFALVAKIDEEYRKI